MKKYPKKTGHLFLISLLFIILVIELTFLFNSFFWVKKQNIAKSVTAKSQITTSGFPVSPTPTVTPTVTPTPSLDTLIKNAQTAGNNNYGFCQRAPILMYHHIEPADLAQKEKHGWLTVYPDYFEKQMSYLASSGYTAISVDQLVAALIGHTNLPAKSVIITMDDGYSDIYTYAYPVLQKYRLVTNLMIPTGLLENPGYLTWGQLKEMVNSGLVYAYDHTWSHLSLGNATKERIQYEISTGKKQLEDHLDKTVNIFAYPYGSETNQVIEILRSNGFVAALSTIPGYWQCDSFIMSLHRTRIGNTSLSFYGL